MNSTVQLRTAADSNAFLGPVSTKETSELNLVVKAVPVPSTCWVFEIVEVKNSLVPVLQKLQQQNSLNGQKCVAPIQKYNILKYVNFCAFWATLGKVITFQSKRHLGCFYSCQM